MHKFKQTALHDSGGSSREGRLQCPDQQPAERGFGRERAAAECAHRGGCSASEDVEYKRDSKKWQEP